MQLDPSLFVSPNVHARKVQLGDGKEHDLFFREIPLGTFRAWQMAEMSDDPEQRIKAPAMLIAAGLCDEDGKPAISTDKAAELKPAVAEKIIKAILQVNEFNGKKRSPSVEESGSATS